MHPRTLKPLSSPSGETCWNCTWHPFSYSGCCVTTLSSFYLLQRAEWAGMSETDPERIHAPFLAVCARLHLCAPLFFSDPSCFLLSFLFYHVFLLKGTFIELLHVASCLKRCLHVIYVGLLQTPFSCSPRGSIVLLLRCFYCAARLQT